jgi:hypothetical protein
VKIYYATHKEKKYYWTLLFSVPLFIVIFVGIVVITLHFTSIYDVLVILLLSTYDFFILRHIFWTLFGKEVVEIKDSELIIKQGGTFFTLPKTYKIKKVSNIRIEFTKLIFVNFLVEKGAFMRLPSYGPILFDYGGQIIRFGGDIDIDEAENLKSLFERAINNGSKAEGNVN